MAPAAKLTSPIAIVAGGGALPFAVAEAVAARGVTPIVFGFRGFCDGARIAAYRHHWIALGQFGRLTRLLRAEGCRTIVFIGSLVRPSLKEIKLDWGTLRVLPSIVAGFRGGDDHLLTTIGRLFEDEGFHLLALPEVAPELLMPPGVLTGRAPDDDARRDIRRGLSLLDAVSPFDLGQACVVIDGHVVAMEDIAGTDALLSRVARLRQDGVLRRPVGRGVLVKAPKRGQSTRFDLPALGPATIRAAKEAGLAGVAVAAGLTIAAELQQVIETADAAGLFVAGETL